jgi:hypothetical protein
MTGCIGSTVLSGHIQYLGLKLVGIGYVSKQN